MEKKEMKRWIKIFLIAAIVWIVFILIVSNFFSSPASAQYMPVNCRFQWTADCERMARMNDLEAQQQIITTLRDQQRQQEIMENQRRLEESSRNFSYRD